MTHASHTIARLAVLAALSIAPAAAHAACTGKTLAPANGNDDLLVDEAICVHAGTYKFKDVHIVKGGTLYFDDEVIDFWAANILVENGGVLGAGTPDAPIGRNGGRLTIHLWGRDPIQRNPNANAQGVACTSDAKGHCGIPDAVWNSNLDASGSMKPADKARSIRESGLVDVYPNAAQDEKIAADYFYAYHPLDFQGGKDGQGRQGYFGSKVLGVSWGGSVRLYGAKGATYANGGECGASFPSSSNSSWARLDATTSKGDTALTLDRPLSLSRGDEIVLTSTDYLPGHSESFKVAQDVRCATKVPLDGVVAYVHNGKRASLEHTPLNIGPTRTSNADAVETRAAVGVLTRSIRIVSAGDDKDSDFPPESSGYYYGGHVIFRQGFKQVQVQGVEFRQLGQGGVIGRYPVHFHHARRVPADTFVRDSSINESMTRWIVLHGVQNVTLERDVGFKSIGHGFYLEDGTETDNRLIANLGVFARAGVDNVQNPRKVPGILAAPGLADGPSDSMPYKSDYNHPTIFWIMNGWNDFRDNLAVGAGTCGVCYWLVPGANSGMSSQMKWTSYASMQTTVDRAGMTPLKSFEGNMCSTAMTSFQTVTETTGCTGVQTSNGPFPTLKPLPNPLAPAQPSPSYYPTLGNSGRFGTRCTKDDCSTVPRCGAGALDDCMVTVLSHYTTSFNWAAFNFAALWLRPQWYLVTDSAITDSQGAGLTIVTGGGYTDSDIVPGHWGLVRKSAFIGQTQPDNPYASNGGPFNPQALACATDSNGNRPGNHCLSVDDGVSFEVSNFGMYQRLFSVYDGPAFQESNTYLDIRHRAIDDCKPFTDKANKTGRCDPIDMSRGRQSRWLAGAVLGLPKTPSGGCYMPNAAIGWKQPNGFYYPPAFHSQNLYFENVDTRHFVITPLLKGNTLDTDYDRVAAQYCNWNEKLFDGFAGNDRQTVLNDDDGTLTGFKDTTVINNDEFFAAPVDSIECKSEASSRTSPYKYVSTVLYPQCAKTGQCALPPDEVVSGGKIIDRNANSGDWNRACTNERCYGVPLVREDAMPRADKGEVREIRMMGQSTGQRSTLTVNGGTYYIDTAVSKAAQLSGSCSPRNGNDPPCVINEFKAGQTYYVFLIYAYPDTRQTYRFYVGKNAQFDPASIRLVRAEIGSDPPTFHDAEGVKPSRAGWYKDDPSSGVVEVEMSVSDFGAQAISKQFSLARAAHCQPQSFCRVSSGACVGVNSDNDVACSWTQTPPDCPSGGCVGFRFTLPADFKVAEGDDFKHLRPTPACVRKQAPWDKSLAPVPTSDGCPNPADLHPDDFCAN